MYMNKIYYSDGIYGVKTAAKYYFNKDLKDRRLLNLPIWLDFRRFLILIISMIILSLQKNVKIQSFI